MYVCTVYGGVGTLLRLVGHISLVVLPCVV
jgi:hypothetical protein